MKRLIIIAVSILISCAMHGQEITGQWNGALDIQGVQLRIVFNIDKSDSGYTATMDSPDQGAKGIPVTSTTFENAVLNIAISNLGISYHGTLNSEHVFVGDFKQSGQSFPMNLSKDKIEKKKIVRPQEPATPYSYYAEEVTFENKKDSITLAGTLTLPKKEGSFPVVVLISGSGPQNRDEEIFGHKPFLVLADYLTKKGIAVLRFDDRGTADSKGDFNTATTVDFSRDVEAAVAYLKTRKEINSKKIGLIGHSEGGIIAPMVAVNSNDVSFIVLLAGTGIPGDQIMVMQQELIGKASGKADDVLEKNKKINKELFDIVIKSTNTDTLKVDIANYFKQLFKDTPDFAKQIGMTEDEWIKGQIAAIASPWMQYFIKYNPALMLEKVTCPVLALNGEKDLQVDATVNLDAIKKALQKGGNKNVATKELKGLNHLFQECKTGSPDEYNAIEQTFSPKAMEEIATWVLKQVK